VGDWKEGGAPLPSVRILGVQERTPRFGEVGDDRGVWKGGKAPFLWHGWVDKGGEGALILNLRSLAGRRSQASRLRPDSATPALNINKTLNIL